MNADDKRHGSTAGYLAHYHHNTRPCDPCYQAHLAYRRNRHRQIAYGRWNPWTDAEPVRAHVRQLMDAGVGTRAIVLRSGVNRETLGGLLWGKGGQPTTKRMRTESANAILAVTVDDGFWMPTYTITRRIQALAALGYTSYDIADRLNMRQSSMRGWYAGTTGRVSASKFEAVAALYEELCMKPGPSNSARMRAVAKGWLPPLAWDDIDDETECPQVGPSRNHTDPDSIDDTVVERILGGEWRLTCTRAEKEAVTAQWAEWGRPFKHLADRTGWRVERYKPAKDAA